MKYNNGPMVNTIPAANELRKVKGFNPLKFLRQATSKTGEKVWRLELPYKRLWFRLACPSGRMVIKPLRITDQLAVFEALVYAEKEDTEPLSRFTASVSSEEIPDGKYVEAAQDSALNTALENAGFGIQLCDFVQNTSSSWYGSEISVSAVENVNAMEPTVPKTAFSINSVATKPMAEEIEHAAPTLVKSVSKNVQIETPAETPEAIPLEASVNAPTVEVPKFSQPLIEKTFSAKTIDASAPVKAEPVPSPITPSMKQPEQIKTVNPMQMLPDNGKSDPLQQESPAEHSQKIQTAPSYTADMTVEEICKVMTMEEAKAYVVQGGICKGWTLEQVAERRAPSLRFYMCSDTGDNVLKAAATLILQELNQRKVG